MEMIDPGVAFGRIVILTLISFGIFLSLTIDKRKKIRYNDFSD